MRLNNLTIPKGSRKKVKRVGRGSSSGKGKTCGRGENGAKSRTGYTQGRGFEGGQMPIQRKVPKRGMSKGSKQNMMRNIRMQYKLIKTSFFNRFDNGTKIDEEFLISNSIIKPMEINSVKILSDKKLEKKINFAQGFSFSKNAITEIEKQGGTVITEEKEVKKLKGSKVQGLITEKAEKEKTIDNGQLTIDNGNKVNSEELIVNSEEKETKTTGQAEKEKVKLETTTKNTEKKEVKPETTTKNTEKKEVEPETIEEKEVRGTEYGVRSEEKTEDKEDKEDKEEKEDKEDKDKGQKE